MCGIVGVVSHDAVNTQLFDALTALQHRGQDAAGIATCSGRHLEMIKNNGLVRDVFRTSQMLRLVGNMGIGHVRYPTAGSLLGSEAQPFYVNSPYGIALAHNGNLTNASELKRELLETDLRHINSDSDSEILLNVLAHELQKLQKHDLDEGDIFSAVSGVHKRCRGAYAVVAMIAGFGLVAFRDPHGIRPLIYGQRKSAQGMDYLIASESAVLTAADFEVLDDIAAGAAIYINTQGKVFHQQCAKKPVHTPCLFEYVYLARPDSYLDKISVYKVRLRLGENLADKIQRQWGDHQIDVVMPIPDTSRTAAATLARRLEVKFREGLVRNRYVGRTFIMPGQQVRKKSVRTKLNPIDLEFKDKNVLLVDDSIVRGTTAKTIIQMARDAGAKKVYFASAAPQVRYPNVYGIDMPAAKELIAHNRTDEEICQALGADGLIFQDLDVLVRAAQEGNSHIKRFEDSIFTGAYVTDDIGQAYLQDLEERRSEKACV